MKPLTLPLALVLAAVSLVLVTGCRAALGTPTMTAMDHVHGAAADRPATHGMLVVGEDTIFLSHLPMFHSPHDYQVILEVKLHGASQDPQAVYVQDRHATGSKLYTLVPEKFVLPEVVAGKRSFHADLYRGHFERDGEPIATGLTVDIVQVVYFRRFDPAAAHPAHAQYLLFGKDREAFLAHLVTARPDFDQILSASAPAQLSPELLEQGIAVEFPGLDGSTALEAGKTLMGRWPGMPSAVAMSAGSEIYREVDELSM